MRVNSCERPCERPKSVCQNCETPLISLISQSETFPFRRYTVSVPHLKQTCHAHRKQSTTEFATAARPRCRGASPYEPRFQATVAAMFALSSSCGILNGSVVDSGAHVGGESCLYADYAPERIVHAIEPLRANVDLMRTRYRDRANLIPLQAGLGSINRVVDIASTKVVARGIGGRGAAMLRNVAQAKSVTLHRAEDSPTALQSVRQFVRRTLTVRCPSFKYAPRSRQDHAARSRRGITPRDHAKVTPRLRRQVTPRSRGLAGCQRAPCSHIARARPSSLAHTPLRGGVCPMAIRHRRHRCRHRRRHCRRHRHCRSH